MKGEHHERAQRLLDVLAVEGISEGERAWLDAHLEGCSGCAAYAASVERTVSGLRTVSVPLDPALVKATRRRVLIRAQELREHESRLRALWISCALSWVLGALTAPLLWQGLAWVGQRLALPEALWRVAFVFWWTLPAAVVAAALTWQRLRTPIENRHSVTPPR